MEISRRNSSKSTGIDTFLSGLSEGIIMDLNRNKRKNGARDHEPCEFSQQSILSAMDRFVQAVNNMDDTIMVPSRLLDMALQSDHENNSPPTGRSHNGDGTVLPADGVNTDLYSFYNMLNTVKTELIWGAADGSAHLTDKDTGGLLHRTPSTTSTTSSKGGNRKSSSTRRMSTISMHSYSDSDVESESSTECDSGVDTDEQSQRVATAFRQHLSGLFHSLHQLTESANYLTTRYQDEVVGSS